jgi:transposase-like protein
VSVTAGTIFDGTRTPLTVWFQAAWQLTSQKNGISALGLQRVLGLGSYQTAWAMLHRYRRAMVRPGRERLVGVVEVDETLVGGLTPGRKGRAAGAKDLVVVAVEQHERGLGRCRLQLVGDATSATLGRFLADNVTEGATVITDGWQGYRSATKGYQHERLVVTGHDPNTLMPGVHRVASLLKRWLLGTHQGGIASTHLQDYLDEFTFRFNRRTSRARGLLFFRLLEQAVDHDPVRYRDLVVNPEIGNPRARHPTGPRHQPGTLALPPADRPWRAASR